MLDLNGVEIKVGDRIVYAVSGYNHAVSLRVGEVVSVTPGAYPYLDHLTVRPEGGGRVVRINLKGARSAPKVMVL